jgi:hypothetical protein
MQKQQDLAARLPPTGIHLGSPTARCGDHAIGAQARSLNRGIMAAAVNDDHLDPKGAQMGEPIERSYDLFAFIENRNDNGELCQ